MCTIEMTRNHGYQKSPKVPTRTVKQGQFSKPILGIEVSFRVGVTIRVRFRVRVRI